MSKRDAAMNWDEYFKDFLLDQSAEPHDYWEKLRKFRDNDDLCEDCEVRVKGLCSSFDADANLCRKVCALIAEAV